jgi:hypothetical protein
MGYSDFSGMIDPITMGADLAPPVDTTLPVLEPGGQLADSGGGGSSFFGNVGGFLTSHPSLLPRALSISQSFLGNTGTSGLSTATDSSGAPRASRGMARSINRAQARAMGLSVGHRRINPLNPKALRRAIRRVMRFQKFAQSVLYITHPGARAHVFHRGHPKRRARRRHF